MTKLCFYVGIAAVATLSGAALARPIGSINSLQTAPYWYSDYFGSTLTINGNDQSAGASTTEALSSLHIVDTAFPGGPHYTNRHQAALAVGGVPYLFNSADGDFRFDVDVTIFTALPVGTSAKTEAGIWFGTAGSFPSSAGADIGQFVLLPSNGGEIAAFGGTLPYTSSTNVGTGTGYSPQLGLASYGGTFHMTMIFYAASSVVVYGIDGLYTQAYGISHLGVDGFAANSMLGVFVQGPNEFGAATGTVDVLFDNISITVPTPASAALLGFGGLVAFRRRR